MVGSVAIVTGASSGIGRASAIRLAQDFDAVALSARDADGLEATAIEIRKAGKQAIAIAQDLSSPLAADAIVTAAMDSLGRIDALVNVAGAVAGMDVFEMTDDQWHAGMAVKFHGARRLTLRAWEALKETKGSVVFISGTSAQAPRASQAAVAAINAAIEALAKAFAERGVADGVQVNSVSPGAIMTRRRQAMLQRGATARGIALEETQTEFLNVAGIMRFGEPKEIADLIAFVVSPGARWLTGSVLRMDGGEVKSI